MFRYKDSIIIFCAFCGHKGNSYESAYVTESERRATYVETRGASADRNRRERKDEQRRRAKSSGAAMEIGRGKQRRMTTTENATSFEVTKRAKGSTGGASALGAASASGAAGTSDAIGGVGSKARDFGSSANVQIEESRSRQGAAQKQIAGTAKSSSALGSASAPGAADTSDAIGGVGGKAKGAGSSADVQVEESLSRQGGAQKQIADTAKSSSALGAQSGLSPSDTSKLEADAGLKKSGASAASQKKTQSGSAQVHVQESLSRANNAGSKRDSGPDQPAGMLKSSSAGNQNESGPSNASGLSSSGSSGLHGSKIKPSADLAEVKIEESLNRGHIGGSSKGPAQSQASHTGKSPSSTSSTIASGAVETGKPNVKSENDSKITGASSTGLSKPQKESHTSRELTSGMSKSQPIGAKSTSGSGVLELGKSGASSKLKGSENSADVKVEESLGHEHAAGSSKTKSKDVIPSMKKSSALDSLSGASAADKASAEIAKDSKSATATLIYSPENREMQVDRGHAPGVSKTSTLRAKSTPDSDISGLGKSGASSGHMSKLRGSGNSADVRVEESLGREHAAGPGKTKSKDIIPSVDKSSASDRSRGPSAVDKVSTEVAKGSRKGATTSSYASENRELQASRGQTSGMSKTSTLRAKTTSDSSAGLVESGGPSAHGSKMRRSAGSADVDIEESLKRVAAAGASKGADRSFVAGLGKSSALQSGSATAGASANARQSGTVEADIELDKNLKKTGATSASHAYEYNVKHTASEHASGKPKLSTMRGVKASEAFETTNKQSHSSTATGAGQSANIAESMMISGVAARSASPKEKEFAKKKKRKYRYTTTTTTLTAERARQEEERRRLSQIQSTDLSGSRVGNSTGKSTTSTTPGSAAASVSMNISATKSASTHSPKPTYDDYQKKKKKKDF